MSQDIINEVYFLLSSILMGIIITFVYDFFLIWRRLLRHSPFFVSLEDFIFWVACAIAVFYMLYEENDGILRWFAVFGAAMGMLIYKKIIGNHFVKIISTCIEKEIYLIRKVLGFLFKPIIWLLKKLKKFCTDLLKKQRRLAKYTKKKLTVCIKMLKITLCKH
jgi:spore cortex biosynthesis protein YabQ